MTERRDFFCYATHAATASASTSSVSAAAGSNALQTELVRLYDVDRTVINLNAAQYEAMPREVQAHDFERWMWVTRYNSTLLRSAARGIQRDPELNKSRAAVSHPIGATQNLWCGFRGLLVAQMGGRTAGHRRHLYQEGKTGRHSAVAGQQALPD